MSLDAAFFESWQRHNKIIQNVLKILNDENLKARATPTSPTVAEQFADAQDARVGFLSKIAPEFSAKLPQLYRQEGQQYIYEYDKKKIVTAFKKSQAAVQSAVEARSRTKKGKTIGMDVVYSHPLHFLQHMLWHEAYHIGQIMLALKVSGSTMDEKTQQKAVWKVWKS